MGWEMFADSTVDSLGITGLIGLVVAVIVAGGGILLAWLNNGGRLMRRVDELTTQVFKVQDDLKTCREDHSGALLREKDLKHDLASTQRRIEALESGAKLSSPVFPMPGVVIASYDGTVRVFSPSLTASIGWLPSEVEGNNIEMLVPPEFLEAHRAGFGGVVKGTVPLSPTTRINTYILDKMGRRVPVSITPRKWATGEGLVTAVIQVRSSATQAEARQPVLPDITTVAPPRDGGA